VEKATIYVYLRKLGGGFREDLAGAEEEIIMTANSMKKKCH